MQTAAHYGPGLTHTATIRALHAGDAALPALRGYLGMGLPGLHVLKMAPQADILPPLAETLQHWRPSLILTGVRSETGWSGGCLPYVLAERLGYTLAANIDHVLVNPDDGTAELRQVCPRGRRRILKAGLPVIATVDPAAPAPRQSAFARERQGRLVVTAWSGEMHAAPSPGEARPARRRPRRLQSPVAGNSADARLQALTRSAGSVGQVLEPGSPDAAALAIYTYLVEHGILDIEMSRRPDSVPGG